LEKFELGSMRVHKKDTVLPMLENYDSLQEKKYDSLFIFTN